MSQSMENNFKVTCNRNVRNAVSYSSP